MKFRYTWRHLICLCGWMALAACSSPTNIAYFQDAQQIQGMALQERQMFRLQPGDKINIVVNSSDPMLSSQFTLTSQAQRGTLGASVKPITNAGSSTATGISQAIAYTVDDQGDISFPVLGKVSVVGKSRDEVAAYIAKRLIERDLVKDPIVTVEYVNMGVNVLGEVNKPGHIDVTKDHFTLLDALSYAGDLTVNGERETVMVLRNVDGEARTYYVNLLSKKEVLESPAFYLQQNDLIYVSPNSKRKREANASGNTLSSPTFWISVASLITTISALLAK